jgi:hypothetical protein
MGTFYLICFLRLIQKLLKYRIRRVLRDAFAFQERKIRSIQIARAPAQATLYRALPQALCSRNSLHAEENFSQARSICSSIIETSVDYRPSRAHTLPLALKPDSKKYREALTGPQLWQQQRPLLRMDHFQNPNRVKQNGGRKLLSE